MGERLLQAGNRDGGIVVEQYPDAAIQILAELAGIDGSIWTLGLAATLDHPNISRQVKALAACTVPPNPFFDLPMLRAAVGYIGSSAIRFLTLTELVDGKEQLRLFAPVETTRRGIPRRRVLRVWSNFYWPNSMPLLDNSKVEMVVAKLADAITAINNPGAPVLVFEDMDMGSSFAKSIGQSRVLAGHTAIGCQHERAVLKPLKSGTYDAVFISGKRRQRLKKAMQRLQQLGKVSYENVSSPSQIMPCLEEFLQLEVGGWKGKRGTALISRADTAGFTRRIVANMATENRCAIHTIRLDDTVIASIIVFRAGGYYFTWKMAFDEAYAKYSAGVQLITRLNHQLTQTSGFAGIDSLAAKDNTTARRFWPERVRMGHIVIGFGPKGHRSAVAVSKALEREANIRSTVKRLLGR